jgi:two-component system, chemotaxis family, protein-glutamate methylesterase/glutaminase
MNGKSVLDNPTKPGAHVTRVLMVDDSPLVNNLLSAMLEDTPDIQVVGQAADGQEAIRMAMRLRPDVITMDIRMPRMDGLEAIRHIMRVHPTPIVVVSSSVYASDYNTAFNAIEAGALTVIEKPKGLGVQDYEAVRDQLITAIRTMSGVAVVSRYEGKPRADGIGPRTALLHTYYMRSVQAIAIAASTGGPPVLMQILSGLPQDFSMPILVVQHILPAFVQGFSEWLNSRANLPVSVAREGDELAPGRVFLAPGEAHLTVAADRTIRLLHSQPINGQRPSATPLFESVAKVFGPNAVGIVLTGMGEDGADGVEKLGKAGSHIIAQDEGSCIVFGMPKAAIQRGTVDEILSPEEIITRLTKLHRHLQSPSATR